VAVTFVPFKLKLSSNPIRLVHHKELLSAFSFAFDKMADSSSQPPALTATYNSPTNAVFQHVQPLQTPPTTSSKDRVAYLSSLRKATVELQERINKELTDRMEEDKAKDVNGGATGKAIDEKKEEENYGEEVVEED